MYSTLFDFDDILLTPASISSINSRKEVNVFDENLMLPLFTAPMDTVINEDNAVNFINSKIYSIIPRGLNNSKHSWNPKKWYSYGLDEFENWFLLGERFNPAGYPYPTPIDFDESDLKYYALIDIANGHMKRLYDLAKRAKEKYGDKLVLMIGNVANPTTYKEYAQIGVDYIRLGIGNGSVCTTTANTAVGYPMASLISETYKIKNYLNYETKIVADGGFKNFSDIIKALALGADYVMLGSIFNKALESAGDLVVQRTYEEYLSFDQYLNYIKDWAEEDVTTVEYKEKVLNRLLDDGFKGGRLYKKYRGMSTKEVQQSWGRTELKTAEGISKYQKVEYKLEGWCQNFKDYLASAMSYTDSRNLNEFKNSDYKFITQNSLNRFKK